MALSGGGHEVAAADVVREVPLIVPFSIGSLSLSKLPFLSTQGALLLPILLRGELEVLQDAVHVEGVVALPPHCHGNGGRGKTKRERGCVDVMWSKRNG